MPLNFGEVPEPTIGKRLTKEERRRRRFRGDSKNIRRGLSQLNDEDELLQDVEERHANIKREISRDPDKYTQDMTTAQFGDLPAGWAYFGPSDVVELQKNMVNRLSSKDEDNIQPILYQHFDHDYQWYVLGMESNDRRGQLIQIQTSISAEEAVRMSKENLEYILNSMVFKLAQNYGGTR